MTDFERIPPQDKNAEQAVLGALLIDPDSYSRIMHMLSPESFYNPIHKIIYSGIKKLKSTNIPVDIVTLSNYLHEQNNLEKIGGRAYINDLAFAVITSANIEYYAEIVNEKYVLRQFITLGTELQRLGYENNEKDDIVNFANKTLSEISNLSANKEGKNLFDILIKRYSEIGDNFDQVQNGKPIEMKGVIKTNLETFDKYMRGGFKKGELTLIAAKSRTGKTAFEIALERNIALNNPDIVIADFQMETPEEELADRHLANLTGIKKGYLTYVNNLSGDMFNVLAKSLNTDSAQIQVFQDPDFNVIEIEAKARQLFDSTGKSGIIFIDNLQLLSDINRGKSEIEKTDNLTRDCKKMAQRLNVPVVLLAQLVKDAEDERKPVVKDIRGSGQIIANTDKIILLHCESALTGAELVDMEIIFGKVRGGQEGAIKMKFDRSNNRFYETNG
jgi:replicative DNA helicase